MPLKKFEKHLLNEKWQESIKDFDCGSGKDNSNFENLNNFLKNEALRYNQENYSRTNIYLENGTCVAYYSLAMNAIKDPRINIDDSYKSLKSYPALFLTRFAIDKRYHKSGIGKAILNDIIKHAYENKEIASKFLFLDTYPESISWYLGNPLFTILYNDMAERIEKCCETRIIKELNIRLKNGYAIEYEFNNETEIDSLKKNCENILNAHVSNLFEGIACENPLLENCRSRIKLNFEQNRPHIKLENFNTRQNVSTIRDWFKEKNNVLNFDITIPLYLDINKYYKAIYG